MLTVFIDSSVLVAMCISAKGAASAEGATIDVFDTPIIAAARKAKVDALVTFDRKHLIKPAVADYIGAIVTTPDQIVKQVRAKLR